MSNVQLWREEVQSIREGLQGGSLAQNLGEESTGLRDLLRCQAHVRSNTDGHALDWCAEFYRAGAVTQHRQASGPILHHATVTGSPSHMWIAHSMVEDKGADYVVGTYMLSGRSANATGQWSVASAARLIKSGCEARRVIPITGPPKGKPGALLDALQGEGIVPLFGNALEAALAVDRLHGSHGESALNSILQGQTAWHDHVAFTPAELLSVGLKPARNEDDESLERFLARWAFPDCPIQPVPPLPAVWSHAYARAIAAWTLLLGDDVLLEAFVDAFGIYHARMSEPGEHGNRWRRELRQAQEMKPDMTGAAAVGPEHLKKPIELPDNHPLNQLLATLALIKGRVMAPIFYAKGGLTNAAPGDFGRWFPPFPPRRTLRERVTSAVGGLLSLGLPMSTRIQEYVRDGRPSRARWMEGHEAIVPETWLSLHGAEDDIPALSVENSIIHATSNSLNQKSVQGWVEGTARTLADAARKHAARELGIRIAPTAIGLVVNNLATHYLEDLSGIHQDNPVLKVYDTIHEGQALLEDVLATREKLGSRLDRSILNPRRFQPRFLLWSSGAENITESALIDKSGRAPMGDTLT